MTRTPNGATDWNSHIGISIRLEHAAADLYDGERDTSLAKGDAEFDVLAVPQQGRDRDIDAQLFTFIKSDYLGQGEHDHVTDENIFAAQVDYYDSGRLPLSAVIEDHARYYMRSPSEPTS